MTEYSDYKDTSLAEVDYSAEITAVNIATFFGVFFTEKSTKVFPVISSQSTEANQTDSADLYANEAVMTFPDYEFTATDTAQALAQQFEALEL